MLVPASVTVPVAAVVATPIVVVDMALFWHFNVFNVAVPVAAESGMSRRPKTGRVSCRSACTWAVEAVVVTTP